MGRTDRNEQGLTRLIASIGWLAAFQPVLGLAQSTSRSAAETTVSVLRANNEAAKFRDMCKLFYDEAVFKQSRTAHLATLKNIDNTARAAQRCLDAAERAIGTWGPRVDLCDSAFQTIRDSVKGSPPEREAQSIILQCQRWSTEVEGVVSKLNKAFDELKLLANKSSWDAGVWGETGESGETNDSKGRALIEQARSRLNAGDKKGARAALTQAQRLGWNDLDVVNALEHR